MGLGETLRKPIGYATAMMGSVVSLHAIDRLTWITDCLDFVAESTYCFLRTPLKNFSFPELTIGLMLAEFGCLISGREKAAKVFGVAAIASALLGIVNSATFLSFDLARFGFESGPWTTDAATNLTLCAAALLIMRWGSRNLLNHNPE